MRFVFMPWVVLTLALASSEVALPCEQSEPIETITRDVALASRARAESVESVTGTEQPPN